MFGNVLGSLQELTAALGMSTQTLMLVPIVTVVVAASIFSGQAARVGVWLEDLMYRVGMWKG